MGWSLILRSLRSLKAPRQDEANIKCWNLSSKLGKKLISSSSSSNMSLGGYFYQIDWLTSWWTIRIEIEIKAATLWLSCIRRQKIISHGRDGRWLEPRGWENSLLIIIKRISSLWDRNWCFVGIPLGSWSSI